jgi:hypothetical protein
MKRLHLKNDPQHRTLIENVSLTLFRGVLLK